MEQKIWSKTLLTCYCCLEKISDAIDHLVYLNSINSSKMNTDAFSCVNKILELTERKKSIINLKVITENALSQIEPMNARILILRYFDKVKTENCAKILNLSKRTYFRKLKSAIDSFSCKLNSLGYTTQKINSLTKNEIWINDLYNSIYKQELSKTLNHKNDVIDDMSLLGHAFNSLKKINGYTVKVATA